MRDQLVGYLLGALEPSEEQAVASRLAEDEQLRNDLESLRRGLERLDCDEAAEDVPFGLATRTCEWLRCQPHATIARELAHPPGRWSIQDFVVAAGICMAASLLFFPAVSESRRQAMITSCQHHLHLIGMGLMQYADVFGEKFPYVADPTGQTAGSVSLAGLVRSGFLTQKEALLCPAAGVGLPTESEAGSQVPTVPDLNENDVVLTSYGSTFGHIADGYYWPPKHQGRPRFVVVADRADRLVATTTEAVVLSPSHGKCGNNSLFDDGHVEFLTTCEVPCGTSCDDIYRNDRGQVEPGVHVNDAVVINPSDRYIMPAGMQVHP